jgi:hypothetical protein
MEVSEWTTYDEDELNILKQMKALGVKWQRNRQGHQSINQSINQPVMSTTTEISYSGMQSRRHYVSITSPLRLHYVSITSPLRLHYVSITSPLRLHYVAITSVEGLVRCDFIFSLGHFFSPFLFRKPSLPFSSSSI